MAAVRVSVGAGADAVEGDVLGWRTQIDELAPNNLLDIDPALAIVRVLQCAVVSNTAVTET